eukprot:TRINITY_DN19839_c0_g1_i1.p1 TRINITY_DN19839_c0_g1~~TRINITY_DN19839_c0_g1_i1.p1  ORF type:complete len:466 (-),score=101.32 TRINITY_DN19839_c0_g1_i1:126-1523(-)
MWAYQEWHLLAAVMTGSFLVSGVIFGWASLLLIFRDDGVDEEVGESVLTLTYTLGVSAQTGMSFFAGALVDLKGPRLAGILGISIACLGLFLVGIISNSSALPIGYFLVGAGAAINYFASFSVSFRHPQRQALVLAGVNAMFDAGATVFYGAYLAYKWASITRETVFVGLMVLVGLVGGSTFVLWGAAERHGLEKAQQADEPEDEPEKVQIAQSSTPVDFVTLEDREIREQFKSSHFAFTCVFGIVHITRSNIFLGVMGDYLAELGDAEHGNPLTSLLSIGLAFGVAAVPLISMSMRRLGALKTLRVVNALGVVSYLPLLIPNLWCQALSCLLYPMYRGFLFAVLTTFVAEAFGELSVGRVFGCVCVMSAVVQPVQYPLVEVLAASYGGSLWIVNLTLVLCMAVPVGALWLFERNQQHALRCQAGTIQHSSISGVDELEEDGEDSKVEMVLVSGSSVDELSLIHI